MAFTITTNMPGANADYVRYLHQEGQKLTKTDTSKGSAKLDFALVPWETGFVKLTRGSYVTVQTSTYGKWFTGFVTNDPDLTFLGKVNGTPVWGYKYQATSDEFILSLNPVGIVPPFFNMRMGAILKVLAARLAPDFFDVTNVQDGPIVAQYVPDPTKKFIDIAKEFCDGASYVFYGNDRKLYFKPQDDATLPPVVLDGNDTSFTPSRLTGFQASNQPIINDCTVLGDVEPQTYVHEYFVGTGQDAAFPLIASVYGADSTVLIDESFGSSAIDGAKWAAYDTATRYLQVSNGYLNSLGGTSTGTYDVRIQSLSSIPMDGRLRFTHGEWDFLPASGLGVIGGCWTDAPTSGLTGCLYGLRFSSNTLNPVVKGSLDSTQSVPVSTSKRYVIRTIVEFAKLHRKPQIYNYRTSAGVVQSFGGPSTTDNATWTTLVTEIDPANGGLTNQWTMVSTMALTTAESYALYIPLASDNLKATVTGITVSVPLNATLEWSKTIDFKNWNFETWSDWLTPSQWDTVDGVAQDTDFAFSGSAAKMFPSAGVTPFVSQLANGLIETKTPYNVALKMLKTSGMTTGNIVVSFTGTGISGVTYTVPVSSILSSGYQVFSGTLTIGLATVPSDLALRIELVGGTNGESVWVDDVVVSTSYQSQIIGPNEVDAMDGLAPVATIVQTNNGANTNSTLLGSPQFNPGQAQLVFFKDSISMQSNIPPKDVLMRLSYRSAGSAVGRVVDRASVTAESASWLDSGYRSAVRSDLSPRPRNAVECESAAAVIVAENAYQHYQGTYTQWHTYFTSEPRAGALFQFANLGSVATFQVEEITQVVTTIESTSPVERFQHQVTFGQPDHVHRFLSKAARPIGAFQRSSDGVTPKVIDINAVGTVYAPDVTKPSMLTWDDNYLFLDTGQALASNGLWFEARYTDEGWGVDDGKNLVARTASRTFQVPRNARGRMVYIRQAIAGNLCKWSEDQSQASVYSGTAMTKRTDRNPDGDIAQVCTGSFSAAGTMTAAVLVSGSTQYCWSFSARGTAGNTITATVGSATHTFTLSGYWQRFSLAFTQVGAATVSCVVRANQSMSLDLTRYSVEGGTAVEKLYTKTTSSVYGPVSRYSAAVHVAFPVVDEAVSTADTVIQVAGDTTLLPGNYTVKVDATDAVVTITLAPYTNMTGLHATIIKIAGANNVVVDTQGSDTIRGASTYTITDIGQSVTING